MHVLIVEDDTRTARYIARGLVESGHSEVHTGDGDEGLRLALTNDFHCIVMDRMLPGRDGLAIIRELRQAKRSTPVLILSALGEVDDRVHGLRSGGDDYLVKPFALPELLARLEVLARRADSRQEQTRLHVADLELDRLAHSVSRAGREINLQPREFRLLEYLMRNAGRVVTRSMLLENVWDYHFDPQTNVIDVHVSRLRGKIDKGFGAPLLHTVRGAGYCLKAPPP
ncbi:MAG: response regulator transcription factor [Pseudomonadota bacterium]|nr:response regulator transcription factor [Pseudomonadota bacterium]